MKKSAKGNGGQKFTNLQRRVRNLTFQGRVTSGTNVLFVEKNFFRFKIMSYFTKMVYRGSYDDKFRR